ncbi:MAG: glycosyltransferase family 4 protein [Pseudomonadota bacterium]
MSDLLACFAYPGDLTTPTGGYAYGRRVLGEIGASGVRLEPLPLPEAFPHPSQADVEAAIETLWGVPAACPILLDGLAGGALPGDALRQVQAPVVMLCHHPLALETGVPPGRARALKETEVSALAAVAHVITTSETTARILVSDFGVPADRLTVAPPGTDAAARASGSPASDLNILSVGSISRRKGHHLLIDALAPLKDMLWSLRVVGAGLDPAYREELDAQIVAGSLEGRISFLGALDADELEAIYAGSDLFVLASQYEGFGMAFTEAMARGLPVVGCPCGAVPEATRGAALLVPAAELSEALAPLIADAEARRDLGERCWQASQAFQRWPETAGTIADALKEATR